MLIKRVVQLVALVMVGDGVVGFLKPRWHSLLWDLGPKPYRDLMIHFARKPGTARLVYAAEVILGTWLAARQTPEN